ncbi:MAG TPA: glycine betaine ABC transporter substrate-binding protein [Candidatus Acidoferrales bacterium]|nr:glycine betaine ABC transporter substrate-binding protein [Candidatus Acidoferrales bacterium]
MRRVLAAVAVLLAGVMAGCGAARRNTIVIGSKNFTEQVILAELVAQQIESHTRLRVERRFYLWGTYICHQSILAGRIDLYVEYTGTALTAILKEKPAGAAAAVLDRVRRDYARRFHLIVGDPLGFNDSFALVVRGADARRLHLLTISDAVPYARRWSAGFGYEFMERPDGYPSLERAYGLHFASIRLMDLGLLYRALLNGQVDLAAGNSTDGLLAARDLTVLEDDKHDFPPYQAVPIVRPEALERHPELRAALAALAGKVTDEDMRKMNYAVDGEHRDARDVVREFLRANHLD